MLQAAVGELPEGVEGALNVLGKGHGVERDELGGQGLLLRG